MSLEIRGNVNGKEETIYAFNRWGYEPETILIAKQLIAALQEKAYDDFRLPVIRFFESIGGGIEEDYDELGSLKKLFPKEKFKKKARSWSVMIPSEDYSDVESFFDECFGKTPDLVIDLNNKIVLNYLLWQNEIYDYTEEEYQKIVKEYGEPQKIDFDPEEFTFDRLDEMSELIGHKGLVDSGRTVSGLILMPWMQLLSGLYSP